MLYQEIERFQFLFESLKIVLINMVLILMTLVKLFSLGLFKTKVIWNDGYDVKNFVREVTNKILPWKSNYFKDVVIRPNFGKSSISLRQKNHRIWLEKSFFLEKWSWFKFNNLGLALYMFIKDYSSVAKVLKLKVRMFWGINQMFVEVRREKLVGDLFVIPPY